MRIMLRDLSPGTRYHLQARTTSSEDASEWSHRFTIETPVDTMPPATPTNPVIAMAGGGALLSWDPVTLNDDGTKIEDLAGYQVTVTSPDSSSTYVKDVGVTNSMEFTFAMNRKAFGGPKGRLQFFVAAVDAVGNKSGLAQSEVAQVEPLPNITGLEATPQSSAIALSWDPVTHPAFAGYRVYVGTSANFPLTSANDSSSNSYVHPTSMFGTDLWFKVVAADVFGNISATPAVVGPVRPQSPYELDTDAPSVPSNLTAVINNDRMTVSWSAVADTDMRYYIVSYRPVGDTQWTTQNVPYDQTTTAIPVAQGVNYNVRIRASDQMSNMSLWSSVVTTTTATVNTAPAVPTGLAVTPGRDSLQIKWNENTEDDMKNNAGTYDVTVATNSAFTTGVLQYRTGATTLSVNGVDTNTKYWVRVRATDSGGLSSNYSTSVSATTGTFPETSLSDGQAPSSSPIPVATGGFGYIHAAWTPVANNDPVTYEVHLGTTLGFAVSASTKVAEISGSTVIIETTASGAELAYGQNYYVKTIAKDRDDAAPASGASNVVQVSKVGDGDVTVTPGGIGASTPSEVTSAVNAKFNVALKNSVVQYAVNSSESVPPTSGWSTETPTRTPGSFIWYRTLLTFGDDTTSTSSPALLTGNTGAPGSQGAPGPAGSDGTPAKYVSLTATTQVLTAPATGGATSPTTAVVTGVGMGTTITAWTYSTNGSAFVTTLPVGVTRSGNVVTVTGSTMTAKTITVKMADADGNSDTLTVAKVLDGAKGDTGSTGGTGAPGAPGADAYTVLLSNEAHAFPGTLTTAVAGSTTSTVIAYKGAVQQTATVGTITGQVTGLTTSVSGNNTNAPTITITVTTALVTQGGTLTIPITVDGKSFTKQIAWSVAYKGATGATGGTGATGVGVSSVTPFFQKVAKGASAPAKPTTTTPPVAWGTTEPSYTLNTELYRTDRVIYTNSSVAYTDVTKVSAYGAVEVAIAEAETKANAAKQAAIEQAAIDSKAYTDGQKPDWLDSAALTAQEKADLAEAKALAATVPRVTGDATLMIYRAPVQKGEVGSNLPGSLIIDTPITPTAKMTKVSFSGYNYVGGATEILGEVGFYAYTTATPLIYTSYTNAGSAPVSVRLARKIDTGTISIILDHEDGAWRYYNLAVTEVQISTYAPEEWIDGWAIRRLENLDEYENVLTPVSRDMTSKQYVDGEKSSWLTTAGLTAQEKADLAAAGALNAAKDEIAVLRQQAIDSAANAANLIANPSFEQDLEGWKAELGNAPFTVSTSEFRTGSKSASPPRTTQAILSTPVPVVAGETYRIGVWYNAISANGVHGLRLQTSANGTTWDSVSSGGGWSDINTVNGGGWTEMVNEYVVGPGISYIRMRLAVASHTTGSVYWDDAFIKDITESKRLEQYALQVENRALSRGTDLVTNGTGYLGNNYNFSRFTFDPADAPTGANGSFKSVLGQVSSATSDEAMPVDVSKTYMFSVAARQAGAVGGRIYTGIATYDAAGGTVAPQHYAYMPGSTTKLTQPLAPGDTVIHVESTANWHNGGTASQRHVTIWNYTDSLGKTWPKETYSRIIVTGAYAQNTLTATTIPLLAPWPANMGTHPVGTDLSNGRSGSSYMYIGWVNAVPTNNWEIKTGLVGGVHDGSTGAAVTRFPPGTATVKFIFLTNRNTSGGAQADSQVTYANVSFSDASAANYAANNITETQITDGAISTPKIQTNAIDARVIKSDAVESPHIKAGAIIAGKLATDSVLAGNIKSGEIDTGHLKADAIKASVIEAGAIGTVALAAEAVTAEKIKGATITGDKMVTNSMDANVIKTSTLTSTTITLGTGGIIKTATGGVQITNSGIIIPAGHLDANIIKANTSFVTTINVGAGGAIQSTGYTSGGTTGFQLSNTGLVIKGSGNTVDASVIKGGTITGTTVNVGAGGTLNIDSTAQVKSNNYAINSTGYRLSNTGLEINDGSIDAKTLKANSALVNEIVIGATPTGPGGIRSNDYVANSKGFKLSTAGLEINKGSISAEALRLQVGRNLIHPAFADFEFENMYYSLMPNYFAGYDIVTSDYKFNNKCIRITWNGNSGASVTLALTETAYNATFDPSRKIIVSMWVKAGVVAQSIAIASIFETSGAPVTIESTTKAATTTGWTRIYHVFTPPANATGRMMLRPTLKTASNGRQFFIDGIQVEEVTGGLEEPSPWMAPSTTMIDGGMLTTGVIRSSALNSRNEPFWSINTQGSAVFNRAMVHEEMIVGDPFWKPNLATIKSVSYERNVAGWSIDSDGRAEFNDGTFRGRLGFGMVSTNLVADGSFEEGGENWLDWSDTPNPDRWGWVKSGNHMDVPTKTPALARTGGQSLNLPIGNSTTFVNGVVSPVFSLKAGERYKVSFFYRGQSATASGLRLRLKMSATTTEVADTSAANDIAPDADTSTFITPEGYEEPSPLVSGMAQAPAGSIHGSAVDGSGFYGLTAEFTVPPTKTFATVKIELDRTTTVGAATAVFIDDVTVTRIGRSAAEVSAAGIRLFDDTGSEAGAFVHNRPNYLSIIKDGTNLATISELGEATFSSLSTNAEEISIGGKNLIGRMADYEPAGFFDPEGSEQSRGILEQFARGIIAKGIIPGSATATTGGLQQMSFVAERGRSYKVTFTGARISNTASGATYGPRIHMSVPSTVGGVAPDPSHTSPVIIDSRQRSVSATADDLFGANMKLLNVTADGSGGTQGIKEGTIKLLFSMAVGHSSATVTYPTLEFIVEDVGLTTPDSSEPNTSTGSSPGTESRTGKVKRTRVYKAINSRSWNNNGILSGNDVVQGFAGGTGGINYGAWYFPSTLYTDHASSAINIDKIEVYLYPRHFKHSYGGTALIRLHNGTSPGSSRPGTWVEATSSSMKAAEGKWIVIPKSFYSGFQNGTYRGFGVGPGTSAEYRYYGRFEGRANPPQSFTVAKVRITSTV